MTGVRLPSRPARPPSRLVPSNTVAVVVTLDPSPEILANLSALLPQVRRVVVVDNGSGPSSLGVLTAASSIPVVQVLRNETNEGIARALNQGAAVAFDLGAEWLLTLDQDAAPGQEMVRVAGETFDAYSGDRPVAVIGSEAVDGERFGSAPRGRAHAAWSEVRAVITAGSFVSLAVLWGLGRYREDMFIDYVDIEFCLRARSAGYAILQSHVPSLAHRIGQPTVRQIGPRVVTPTNHSAVRRYFITRNRLWIWSRFWRREPRFVAADLLASKKELIKLLLFEDDRPAKLRAMWAGVRDGLRASRRTVDPFRGGSSREYLQAAGAVVRERPARGPAK